MSAGARETDRAVELVSALARVRTRIADAATQAGRAPSTVTMIAVTKGFPISDVRTLVDLGVTNVGESRDQEARAKLPADLRRRGVRVHFIGQLQTNKCKYVVRYADAVHSVDRPELVTALADAAARAERRIDVFIQVNLDDEPAKDVLATDVVAGRGDPRGGVRPGDLYGLAARVAAREELDLRGVMAVAPLGARPGVAFERLAAVSAQLQAEFPAATAISAGMSGDFEQAIQHGATYVRVGSALLGQRKPHFG